MNELLLEGCTATPLANYLKALGVLRLLSARYPETRGSWRRDRFVLRTSLDREGVERFFLHEYAPTPIMAPWNGGSGFYDKDNKDALQRIMQSDDVRFVGYKTCLAVAESALDGHDRTASPKDDDKVSLLVAIRSQIPDSALGWFDASVLLAGDSPQYPPLLGTGGNDGRLDFTNNFMQRVLDVLPSDDEGAAQASLGWLQTSLFAEAAPGLTKSAIGQFAPGQAGGPNASTGFDADASINPWDFVLMIEGALLFAAATVRRNADDPFGVLSYPFTVRAIAAGSGSLGEGDAGNARGELWMPLWPQFTTHAEVRALMGEGRVALGRKPARDALDFIRAVQHLGGYRGVRSFQRYGLLMRSGKAYLATPLARIDVNESPASSWLDELDTHGWLEKFRRFANDGNTAARFKALRKRLEDVLFALSGKTPGKLETQALLILLGQIQSALASSSKAREAVQPVPRLSERWIIAANDGTPALRIAKALAGLRGVDEVTLPIRAQLFPVERRWAKWITPESDESHRLCDGFEGRLAEALPTLLARRLWLAERFGMNDKPLESPAGATLADLAAFLRDDGMDARIADLLPGLALCDVPQEIDRSGGEGGVPAAFALMKLALTPERTLRSLGALADGQSLPVPTGMLAQLAAGNHGNNAVAIAWRRLRASGASPRFTPGALPALAGIAPKRAAAALLIPLRYGTTAALVRSVTKQPEPDFA
jgi:CRISPR-associated protein Csx17